MYNLNGLILFKQEAVYMLNMILIDDDAFALETLAELIPWQDFGFNVSSIFCDTTKAIEYLYKNTVDCIITDIRMPKPDGMDIVKLCSEEFPNIKIILLSAYRDFQYAQEAIRYNNVVDYVTKPIDYEKFKSSLNHLASNFTSSDFPSEDDIDLKLQIFSDLACGYLTDSEQMQKQLNMLNIDFNPSSTAISVVNFHILDFSHYIKTQWKHESIRFYHAITYLIPFETDEAYFVLALYSHGNISWIILHKTDNYNEVIENFSKHFIENGSKILSFDAVLNNFHTYNNITDLQRNSFFYNEKSINADTISIALDYMNKHYNENISLDAVSAYVFMSPSYFSTYFKQKTGKKFIEMLTQIRMQAAAELLIEKPELSISEICAVIGYNHLGHFYKTFKKHYNVSPNEYRSSHTDDRK